MNSKYRNKFPFFSLFSFVVMLSQNAYANNKTDYIVFEKLRKGEAVEVKKYLDLGGDPNLVYRDASLLEKSADYFHIEIAKLLIANGAKTDRIGRYRRTLAHSFLEGLKSLRRSKSKQVTDEDFKWLAAFIETQPFQGDQNNITPLRLAYTLKKTYVPDYIISNLIALETDFNRQGTDYLGYSYLHNAPANLVKTFIRKGTEADLLDKYERTPLLVALEYGADTETVNLLINAGSDVRLIDKYGDSALNMLAKGLKDSREKQFDQVFLILEMLLKAGADANNVNNMGESALHTLIKYSKEEDIEKVVMLFNSYGANLGLQKYSASETILNALAARNQHGLIEKLIRKGVDPKADSSRNSILTLLLGRSRRMADAEKVEMIKRFAELGVSIEGKNRNNQTLLHMVMKWKSSADKNELVRFLVRNGADPSAKNTNGETPLHLAVASFDLDVIKILAKKGGLSNYNNRGDRPFSYVSTCDEESFSDVVEYFLSKGENINDITKLYLPSCSTEQLKFLVERGFRLNRLDSGTRPGTYFDSMKEGAAKEYLRSENALTDLEIRKLGESAYRCIEKNNLNCLKGVVESGYHPDNAGSYQFPSGKHSVYKHENLNILGAAVKLEHPKLISYLLSEGANPDFAFSKVIEMGDLELVDQFVKAGANVNGFLAGSSDSSLVIAIKNKQYDIAKYLVKNGASTKFEKQISYVHTLPVRPPKEPSFGSPIYHAVQGGNLEFVKYILKSGASLKVDTADGEVVFNELLLAAYKNQFFSLAEFLRSKGLRIPAWGYEHETRAIQLASSAIRFNDIEKVKEIIANGYDFKKDPSEPTGYYRNLQTSLQLARKAGFKELLEYIDKARVGDETPEIIRAALEGNKKKLIKALKKEDVNKVDSVGNNALFYAFEGRHEEISLVLLKHGAKPSLGVGRRYNLLSRASWSHNLTKAILDSNLEISERQLSEALSNAVALRDIPLAKILLAYEAILEEPRGLKYYGLLVAPIRSNDRDMIDFLLENGADINHVSRTAYGAISPLSISLVSNSETSEYLVNYHIENADEVYSPAFLYSIDAAIELGKDEILELMLSGDIASDNLDSLMQSALKHLNFRAVSILLGKGANGNQKTKDGVFYKDKLNDYLEKYGKFDHNQETMDRVKEILNILEN